MISLGAGIPIDEFKRKVGFAFQTGDIDIVQDIVRDFNQGVGWQKTDYDRLAGAQRVSTPSETKQDDAIQSGA
jgi:hypothetical protein